MYSVEVNTGAHTSSLNRVFEPLGSMTRCEISGLYGNPIPSFLRSIHIVSQKDCTSGHSTGKEEGSFYPTSVFVLCDVCQAHWCEMITPCCFDFHLPMKNDIEHFFIYLLTICMSSLRSFYISIPPVFNVFFSCYVLSVFYIS